VKSAQALAQRSRIVLAAAEGLKNTEIAEWFSLDLATVGKWRNRLAVDRLEGWLDEPGLGRPRTVSDARVEEVVIKTLESTPKDATHWSARSMVRDVVGLYLDPPQRRSHREHGQRPARPLFLGLVGRFAPPRGQRPARALGRVVWDVKQVSSLDPCGRAAKPPPPAPAPRRPPPAPTPARAVVLCIDEKSHCGPGSIGRIAGG
jgi:Winged helix-turn helix